MDRRARVRGIGHPTATRSVVRIAVLGFIAALLAPLATSPGAEAASFYTRKRVNGVWVTGKFAKEGARSSHRFRRIARAAPADAPDDIGAVPVPPSPAGEGLVRGASRGDGPETTSSLPRILAGLSEPFPEPLVADERLARLKEALTAHATVLGAKADADVPPAAGPPTVAAATGAAPVRSTEAAGAVRAEPASAKSPAASLAPRSVSYDFETGIKTTVFDNSVVREAFDVAAMKALTPRSPLR